MAAAERFDPATSEREFTVMLTEFGELSFLPLLLGRLAEEAPRARLRVQHLVVDEAADLLARGRLDLVVTSVRLPEERLARRPFMSVDYVVLAAGAHPRLAARGPATASSPRSASSASGARPGTWGRSG